MRNKSEITLVRKCPECENITTDSICSYCGFDFEIEKIEEIEEEISKIRYCENCGQQIKRKNCLFCRVNLGEIKRKELVKRIKKEIKIQKKEYIFASSYYRKQYKNPNNKLKYDTTAIILLSIGLFVVFLYLFKYSIYFY